MPSGRIKLLLGIFLTVQQSTIRTRKKIVQCFVVVTSNYIRVLTNTRVILWGTFNCWLATEPKKYVSYKKNVYISHQKTVSMYVSQCLHIIKC